MNIGLAVRRHGAVGGMEGVAFGFSRWLVQQGCTVDVFCAESTAPIEGVRLRRLEAGGRGVMWKAVSLQKALRNVPVASYDGFLHFERGGYGGTFRAGGGCHAAWASQRTRQWFDSWLTRIDKASMSHAGRVVVNSEMALSDVQHHYGVPVQKLRLVRNGVDLERFQPSTRSADPTVVFMGDDFRRKGLETAIRSVAQLKGVSLKVIGLGKGNFAALAARLGVADRIEFLGHMTRPEQILGSAHAMLLPSRYDPAANACLEAMACGVPVVTTTHNGMAEILPHSWMAVSDAGDAEGCAQVLERVLSTPDLRAECRAVAEGHSSHSSFSQLLSVLLEGHP